MNTYHLDSSAVQGRISGMSDGRLQLMMDALRAAPELFPPLTGHLLELEASARGWDRVH